MWTAQQKCKPNQRQNKTTETMTRNSGYIVQATMLPFKGNRNPTNGKATMFRKPRWRQKASKAYRQSQYCACYTPLDGRPICTRPWQATTNKLKKDSISPLTCVAPGRHAQHDVHDHSQIQRNLNTNPCLQICLHLNKICDRSKDTADLSVQGPGKQQPTN